MKIETWPLARIQPYPTNARKIPAAAVDKVSASLREFGWQQPMVVTPEGSLIVGHVRLLGALANGWTEGPVHIAENLTPAQVKAYRLMDNRSHDEATWDFGLLGTELLELKALDFDLKLTGFEMGEIRQATASKGLTDPDEVPEVPVEPVTRLGDLWLLGEHRLLCGDTTDQSQVMTLMGSALSDLVFTDPPYGVGYDGGTVARDTLIGDHDTALYVPCCTVAAAFSKRGAALYLWHAGTKGVAAAVAAAAAGYEIRCELIWNKNLAQFGALSAQYKQKHEPCYYCFKKGNAPAWYGPNTEVTVWDCKRSNVNEFHPTQKPVELAERALLNSSKGGDVVLDIFAGSGATMMACENLGRAGRLMDIAPAYVDVAVTRWQNFTGREATLDGDGRTFAQIATERGISTV